jgi:hypothetical protein
MARRTNWALIAVAIAACKSVDVELIPPDDGSVTLPGLESLRIDPPSRRINDDGHEPGERATFHAFGRFADGERDISEKVAWSIADGALGTIERGELTTAGVGGHTTISARSGDVSAAAGIEVAIGTVLIGEGVPEDAPEVFGSVTATETIDSTMLEILYPSHETMFPQNIKNVRHQWRAAAELDLFYVSFESVVARVRYYTTDRFFAPDDPTWTQLARTHAGGSMQMTVRGLARAVPDRIYRSTTVTIHFARDEIPGAIYYWSATSHAIFRGKLEAQGPTLFYPRPGQSNSRCVACHSISRDGKKMALVYNERDLRIVDVESGNLDYGQSDGARAGWTAFDPTGTKLLYAFDGRLSLFDVASRSKIADITLPPTEGATHPDWSPDGTKVVVSYALPRPGENEAEDIKDDEAKGTSIAVLSVSADFTFSAPEILLRSTGENDTYAFPTFSPDGRVIAYARLRGKARDNPSSQIYLISADGGAPIPMDRLNRRIGELSDVSALGNTMPVWAPSTGQEISWLSFASLRDYGAVLTGAGRDQLWISAIDTTRIAPGEDPSFAAFWLPFQQTSESNHRALWSSDPADSCLSRVDLCGNGIDDDCSGAADDSCCTPQAEQCGNMIDDDCDLAADEGCNCGPSEICANGADDDCNGLTDGDDPAC